MGIAHGFFVGRLPVEVDVGQDTAPGGLIGYPNISAAIGAVISSGKATLVELDTVLGQEDLYDLLEVISVDAHNRRILNKMEED